MEKNDESFTAVKTEFKALRAEILELDKLRTQYEVLTYTIFMGLFGISFYVGYPIILMMFIQIFWHLPFILFEDCRKAFLGSNTNKTPRV